MINGATGQKLEDLGADHNGRAAKTKLEEKVAIYVKKENGSTEDSEPR